MPDLIAGKPTLLALLQDYYWGGSEVMGMRHKAIADATVSVMIFLEYLPWNLSVWLDQQLAAAPEAMESALDMDVALQRGLRIVGVSTLRSGWPFWSDIKGLCEKFARFGNHVAQSRFRGPR